MKRAAALSGVFFLLWVPALSSAEEATSVAVMDLKARGVDEAAAGALSTEVTNTLAALRVFNVISGEDIKRLLTLEETKQACTGDADASCLAEIGGALGVEHLVYGEVAKLAETYSVSLVLLDTQRAQAINRANVKVNSPGALLKETQSLARGLVAPILESKRGALVLNVMEEGATVRIDDRTIGVTPMKGRIELAMGPHDVEVDKEGFVTFARTVDVLPSEVRVETVMLVPNASFIDDYESGAGTIRTVAWISAGAAVALVGTGAALKLVDDARFDDLVAKEYVEQRGICAELNPGYNGTDFCPTELGRQNDVLSDVDSIETMDTIALVSVVSGAVAGLVSVVLFATGDPPDRYSVYAEAGAQSGLRWRGFGPGLDLSF